VKNSKWGMSKMTQQNRSKRTSNTRETNARQQQWKPASTLPDPNPVEGIVFRWVRKSLQGKVDQTNYSRKLREGWEPCALKDHPEFEGLIDDEAAASGNIEIGGLVLCRIPQEFVDQRKAYYAKTTQAQMDSVDKNLMREEDSRMPLYKERKSTVSFGKGS